MLKRIICILAVLALAAPLPARAAAPRGYRLVAERGQMALYADFSSGHFIFDDGKGGDWRTLPHDLDEQQGVKGAVRNRIGSVFAGTVVDMESGKETAFFSATCDIECESIPDGYAISASIGSDVSLRLEITLSDEFVAVRLPISSLHETQSTVLRDIQLIPSFGAGGSDDQGFILIPDGSGAIIDFNNGRKSSYDEPVYGTDKAQIRAALAVSKQDIALPVYGIARGSTGILAILAEGETAASIRASSSGNGSPYNTAYAAYTLRRRDTQYITNEVYQTLYEEQRTFNSDIELRLYPTAADYVDMARRLNAFIKDAYSLSPLNADGRATYVSIYCGIKERARFLGIPLWNKVGAVTTFKRAGEIIAELSGLTEGMAVQLVGWEADGVMGRASSRISVPLSLGGEKQLKQLADLCQDANVPLYAATSAMTFSVNGGGASVSGSAVRTIGREPAAQYSYKPASLAADWEKPRYLLSPLLLASRLESLAASRMRLGFMGASYLDISAIYSDFVRSASMQDTMLAAASVLSDRPATHGGNLYAAARSSVVVNPPTSSSGMKAANRDVPFYQIALSGLVYYTTRPLGASADLTYDLLFALETGSLLHWELYDAYAADRRHTELPLGAEYWQARTLIASAAAYARIIAEISGVPITGHAVLEDGVSETTYQNGVVVRVDYANGVYHVRGGAFA